MKILFTSKALEQFTNWPSKDKKTYQKIINLIKECQRHPFEGTGKPEPLKGSLSGWWSRRITHEHRLVYRITGRNEAKQLEIASCMFHYE